MDVRKFQSPEGRLKRVLTILKITVYNNNNMSKRTLVLILFLLVVTAVLLAKALTPGKPPVIAPPVVIQPTVTPIIGHSILSFFPNPVIISSSSGSIDVLINTGSDNVTGVQLEMNFDPKVLTIRSTDITPGTFFDAPTILRNAIDKDGNISYLLVIPLTGQPKQGVGTVATIKFRAVRSTAKQTTITLTPRSLVTADGVAPSVLKSISDATIILSQ